MSKERKNERQEKMEINKYKREQRRKRTDNWKERKKDRHFESKIKGKQYREMERTNKTMKKQRKRNKGRRQRNLDRKKNKKRLKKKEKKTKGRKKKERNQEESSNVYKVMLNNSLLNPKKHFINGKFLMFSHLIKHQ